MRVLSALSAFVCLVTIGSAPLQATAQSPGVVREAWDVRGLEAPADLIVDHWGVAHIFAQSERDAYFLQGYNAARDRLWQIDLWRKRGLGRLAASFGPAYVEQDRAARLFLYRGDMEREWGSYAPEARASVEAFVEGVNAFVGEVRAGRRNLPVEFTLTDSLPETWTAEDVVRIRSHALVSNITSEVARARVACVGGLEADMLRRKLEPTHQTVIPKGLNPCDVPEDVLRDYFLATQSVEFDSLVRQRRAEMAPLIQLAEALETGLGQGSNNWVISPGRTETGRAMLANDPHRALGVPSLRYVVGLNAPGLNIIGAGEPALPGVSIGHNDDIAFGITIFAIDQEDLYVYDLKPGGDTHYRYKGRWEPMRVLREVIEVKGEAARTVDLSFTRHGPVLKADRTGGKAFALRTVWNEPGLSGYFGSSRLLKAKTWEDFRAASQAWGAPPLNLVYADIKGNIGWSASGRTPVRGNWDGLMPVPGDGRYEWSGFHGKDVLPSLYNPEQGYFATANEMNLPAGYPAEQNKIAFEWVDRSRIDRIEEVLAGDASVSLREAAALQVDIVSPQARRLVALLQGVTTSDPDVLRALDKLKAWNGAQTVESVPAAIYEVWANKHLGRAVVSRVTPAPARGIVGSGQLEAVLSYLETPDTRLGQDPAGARADVIVESLRSALIELRDRLGEDMETWKWGRLHRAFFEPAVASLADPQLREQMTVGPLQVPGSASTPRAQSYRSSDFQVTAGASVRMVMDAGAWDNSLFVNTPGQSLDPFSSHYRDLFPLWAEGGHAPLRFSREAVERDAERVISLSPAS